MSGNSKPQFIVDEKGNRTSVIVEIEIYQRLLDAWEELEDIRAYDEAKAENGEEIPLEQAVKEIEQSRRDSGRT